MGNFDAAIDRQYLYSLNAKASIGVADLSGLDSGRMPKQVQSFDMSGMSELSNRAYWTGMAIYPANC